MKRERILFWVATALLGLLMLMSAGIYFFNTAQAESILALEGHLAAKDGGGLFSIIALALWLISYVFNKRIYCE